jgi:hypothetical protein
MLGSTPPFVLVKAESCVVIAAHLFSASLECRMRICCGKKSLSVRLAVQLPPHSALARLSGRVGGRASGPPKALIQNVLSSAKQVPALV